MPAGSSAAPPSPPARETRGQPGLWLAAGGGSLALLLVVIWQVDWRAAAGMAAAAAPAWIAVAVVLLVAEGLFASLRMHAFAAAARRQPPARRTAFVVNAWYVLYVAILPARLGEIAGVVLFSRLFGQRAGAAAMNLTVQRIADIAVLAALFGAVLALGGLAAIGTTAAALAAGAVIAFAALVLLRPTAVLTPLALAARRAARRGGRMSRAAARLVLQARLWARHALPRLDGVSALVLTLGKWLANVGALVAVLLALDLGVPAPTLAAIVIANTFLLVVPVPTIGGIGLSEAGLTALLALAGVPVGVAAATSLLMRAVLLLFPAIYWAGTLALVRLWPAVPAGRPA